MDTLSDVAIPDEELSIRAAFAAIRVHLARVSAIRARHTYLLMEMIMAGEADIVAAETRARAAVTAAEARVVALDNANATTVAALRGQVDALTAQVAAGITPAQIQAHIDALTAIADNADSIDPDAKAPPVAVKLAISPTSLSGAVGGSGSLSVSATDASGAAITPAPQAAFASSDATVATVDPISGVVAYVKTGSCTVTATAGSLTASASVTVA